MPPCRPRLKPWQLKRFDDIGRFTIRIEDPGRAKADRRDAFAAAGNLACEKWFRLRQGGRRYQTCSRECRDSRGVKPVFTLALCDRCSAMLHGPFFLRPPQRQREHRPSCDNRQRAERNCAELQPQCLQAVEDPTG
jgi:hypothetical protein